MRVAVVSPYSLSVPGGVQGQVLGLARALRRAGHEATVLGPADGPRWGAGAGDSVVVIGSTVGLPANGSVARLALSPLAARRARCWVRDNQPDIVHLHEPLVPGATLALLGGPAPTVGTFHRAGAVRGALLLSGPAHALVRRLSARTAVSEEARTTARALCGGEYEIIGNGIDIERFAGGDPWPTNAPTVLFVGRHEERKGLGVFLQAFTSLPADTRSRAWVAGEGPLTSPLRAAFPQPNLEWLGRLDDGALASRLSGAHVLCAPALFGESFGVVILEAMAAGCVVVASDIPGYAAVVGEHGMLVPPGDALSLGKALAQVLADVDSGTGRASPAALARALAHAGQWSMDAIAARHLEVYGRALGPPTAVQP